MKKLFALAVAVLSVPAFAATIGSDGFVKVETIKGDSQYRNAKGNSGVQGIRGDWTTPDLHELRALQVGMSKGQVRDVLGSESINYSSGWRGKEWQQAYNYQENQIEGVHNVCIAKIEFDRGIVKQLSFKNVGKNRIGSTVAVCEPAVVAGKNTETIIIREVQPLGDVKIKG